MAVAIASQPIATEPVAEADVAEVVAGATVAETAVASQPSALHLLAEHRRALGYPPVWVAAAKLVVYVAFVLALVVTPPALGLQLLARLLSG